MTADPFADLAADSAPPDSIRWEPPEGTPRHAGGPVEPDWDFFAEPPPEIGELVSAESNLRVGKRPWNLGSRVALTGLVAWAAFMAIDLIGSRHPRDLALVRMIQAGVVVITLALTWLLTRFARTCSFVGTRGVARFRCRGNRNRLRPPEVFLFETADELRTSETKMYSHGIYSGTTYRFIWSSGAGDRRFKLSGTYQGEKAPPKPKDAYHFARSAEDAWTAFLFDRVTASLDRTGAVRFPLGGKRSVAIGPGFLDFQLSGDEPERVYAEELDGIAVDGTAIKIKRPGAKEGWFSSSGVYKLNADQMPNARLFLRLYDSLIANASARIPEAGVEAS